MSTASWTHSQEWLAVGWTMIHFLWSGTLIWLLAALLRALLRHTSPARRYAVALTCLAVLSLLPLFVLLSLPQMAGDPSGLGETTQPAVTSGLLGAAVEDSAGGIPGGPDPTLAREARRLGLWEMARWLPWIWLLGCPVMLGLLAVGSVGLRRLGAGSMLLPDPEVVTLCRTLAASLGMARNVGVRVSQRVITPMLLGVVRPMILLPAAMVTGCSPGWLEMVLLHELAHLRRWDNLINLFQRLVESLLFFHPAVWFVSRWVRFERELCCDDLVVKRTRKPVAYAEILLALADPRRPAAVPALALRRQRLVERIQRLIRPENPPMTTTERVMVLLGALLCPFLLALALHGPWAWGQAESEAPPTRARARPRIHETLERSGHRRVDRTPQEQPPGRHPQDLCLACHRESHAVPLTPEDGECSNCHHLGLESLREHPLALCAPCHDPMPYQSRTLGSARCDDCHDTSTHAGERPLEDCSACHDVAHPLPPALRPQERLPSSDPLEKVIEKLRQEIQRLQREILSLEKRGRELLRSRGEGAQPPPRPPPQRERNRGEMPEPPPEPEARVL